MNTTSQVDIDALRLLTALAETAEQFVNFGRQLTSYSSIRQVRQSLEFRKYTTGPVLEGYVDAELLEGKTLAWLLDLTWDKSTWKLRYSICINQDSNQEVIKQFPEVTGRTIKQLTEILKRTTLELIDSLSIVKSYLA